MMRRRILLGAMAMGYGKVVGVALQLLSVPVLIHFWGLQVYGHWLLLATVPLFLAASDLGFGLAAGNRIIGEVASDARDQAAVTYRSARLIIAAGTLIMGMIAIGTCILLPEIALQAKGGMPVTEARGALAVLCLYGLTAMQTSLFAGVLRSIGQMAISTSLDATVQLLEGLAMVGAVVLGAGPIEAALAYLSIRFVGTIAHWLMARRSAAWLWQTPARASSTRIRELFRPSLAIMMWPLAQAGYLQGTALAVGAAGGVELVPVFTALRTLSRVGLQGVLILVVPIMPELTAALAQGDLPLVRRLAGVVAAICIGWGLAFAVGLIFLGRWIIGLWTGGAIDPPQIMIVLVAIGLIAGIFWYSMCNVLFSVNRHEGFSYFFVVMALICIFLTNIAVERFGITGSAAVGLAFDIVMLFATLLPLRRLIGHFDMRWLGNRGMKT